MSWRLNSRDLDGAWRLTEDEVSAIERVFRSLARDVDLRRLTTTLEHRGRAWLADYSDRSTSRPLDTSRTGGRQLPQRLADVLACVTSGQALIDIGTDHAYLPIAALLTGVSPIAIGIDIARAPLIQAQHHAESAGVKNLKLLRGDGIQPLLTPTEPDAQVHVWSERAELEWRGSIERRAVSVTICGVGGHTAAEKIAELPDWVSEVHVQANHALYSVERALSSWSGHASTPSERITLTAQRLFVTLSATRTHVGVSPRLDPHLDLWRWVRLSRNAHSIANTPPEHIRSERRDELIRIVDLWLSRES